MRIALSALFLILMLPAAWSQVIATHPFDTEISRAVGLEAGATATDVPHHVHYDLKLYNHKASSPPEPGTSGAIRSTSFVRISWRAISTTRTSRI